MDDIILYVSSCLSSFMIICILWRFMEGRYHRVLKNRGIYFGIDFSIVIGASTIAFIGNGFFYVLAWVIAVILSAYFLYYEDFHQPIKRILESEGILFVSIVSEVFGIAAADWFLNTVYLGTQQNTLYVCIKVFLSRVVIIFVDLVIDRLMISKNVPFARQHYLFHLFIILYTLVGMFAAVWSMKHKAVNALSIVNLGCILLADMYFLYSIKAVNSEKYLKNEVELLRNQAEMQYEYYVQQQQKYNKTVRILHDVNKHVKTIEQLYVNGVVEDAVEYTKQIDSMLQPLIPVKYTGNPILDILLTDKAAAMAEKAIKFEIKVNNVDLNFIQAIDATTIFGNLLDNAIEACEELKSNKTIFVSIRGYREMVSIRIENSCKAVKWKNGLLVSSKGTNRGIGLLNVRQSIEKYDGNMKLKNENGKFIVNIILNP